MPEGPSTRRPGACGGPEDTRRPTRKKSSWLCQCTTAASRQARGTGTESFQASDAETGDIITETHAPIQGFADADGLKDDLQILMRRYLQISFVSGVVRYYDSVTPTCIQIYTAVLLQEE